MARSFDGSSQYLTSSATVAYNRNRPWTYAALFKLSTLGTWRSLSTESAAGTNRWDIEFDPTNKLYLERNISGVENRTALTSNFGNTTDWHLLVVTHRDAGATTDIDCWEYNYTSHVLTYEDTGTTWADTDMANTAMTFTISAYNGTQDKFPGEIGWVGIWNFDLGRATKNAPLIWELIRNGAWRVANAAYNCKIFVPLSSNWASKDLATTGVTMNGTGSPPYTVTRFTEKLPKVNPLWLAQAAGGVQQALATNSSWAFSATAALAVTKPLATASSWSFSATADLAVTKALATASSWTFNATADASVTKTLATASSWSFSATAGLSITKALDTASSWSFSATAGLSVTKALAATGSWTWSATADLSGSVVPGLVALTATPLYSVSVSATKLYDVSVSATKLYDVSVSAAA